MARTAWSRLLAGWPQNYQVPGAFPIAAYSEFQGPTQQSHLPYGTIRNGPCIDDAWGWPITEREQEQEIRPGLEQVAVQVLGALARLGRGEPGHGIARSTLENNPYWPARLAAATKSRTHERYVTLMPLALSRTQDDKGRLRWTLFGASQHGPARGFWRSFFSPDGSERPADEALGFLRRLLVTAFGETDEAVADLHDAGLRFLPQGALEPPLHPWTEGPLPRWTEPFLLGEEQPQGGMRYLLTFRPFGLLPETVQKAYLAGRLHILPFPGSLVFWGAPLFSRLRNEMPDAVQIPLLWQVERHGGPGGLRVPQSGWMHEPGGVSATPTPSDRHAPFRNTYRRSHRGARVLRDAPFGQMVSPREDRVAHVLFDASEAIGLYGKPMARNAQVWTHDGRLLLDGPPASRQEIERAALAVSAGGLFGYRFVFPPMRVGRYEVFWHRPLVAFQPSGSGRAVVLHDSPLGVLSASLAGSSNRQAPIELWPQLLARAPYVAAATLFTRSDDPRPHQTARNCRKLLEARACLGDAPLQRSFARTVLTAPAGQTLDDWLDALPGRADDHSQGRWLANELRRGLETEAGVAHEAEPLTFARTSRRSFEVSFWKTIAALSRGRFPNRNNADCARDAATRRAIVHDIRDLARLGDYLLSRHSRAIAAAGMTGRALAGELPFHWRTDFAYTWSDGWCRNQGPEPAERDLIVIIPGRDRRRAIIMADHYDTAYMEDRYREHANRRGPRLAAPGADDNSSATATLLMAAPVLLALSRAGRLGCDVWLVHLTGEEFPADCLGARHLAQCLVERTLAAQLPGGKTHDLSQVAVKGVFVLDMVAHDNPRRRGVFQIAPGDSRESFRLALTAHTANEAWNAAVPGWNQHPARRGRPRRRASATALVSLPPIAPHPLLTGEIRPHDDPKSTLFNTDGQIFSDAGIPVVLFMEDYDIDRSGYHDSRDTMAGIDLDFGAAVAAIAIESVARAAGATASEGH